MQFLRKEVLVCFRAG